MITVCLQGKGEDGVITVCMGVEGVGDSVSR